MHHVHVFLGGGARATAATATNLRELILPRHGRCERACSMHMHMHMHMRMRMHMHAHVVHVACGRSADEARRGTCGRTSVEEAQQEARGPRASSGSPRPRAWDTIHVDSIWIPRDGAAGDALARVTASLYLSHLVSPGPRTLRCAKQWRMGAKHVSKCWPIRRPGHFNIIFIIFLEISSPRTCKSAHIRRSCILAKTIFRHGAGGHEIVVRRLSIEVRVPSSRTPVNRAPRALPLAAAGAYQLSRVCVHTTQLRVALSITNRRLECEASC